MVTEGVNVNRAVFKDRRCTVRRGLSRTEKCFQDKMCTI